MNLNSNLTYTVWPVILAGNLFWRIGGFESNPPIFHLPKLHSVSSLLQNHSLCTRPAARHASLMVGMKFTFESCVRGHRFSKEFCTPKERVGLSVNARKVVQMPCTQCNTDGTKTVQSKVTTICSALSCI